MCSMRLLEYEGKNIFQDFGIPVPERRLISTTGDEIIRAIDEIGLPLVLKAQVPTGGRGKAEGIKVAENRENAENIVGELLGSDLKNYEITSLLAEEKLEIDKEMYCGIVGDRESGVPEVVACSEGGGDIEQIAKESPEKIEFTHIDPLSGFEAYQAKDIIKKLSFPGDVFTEMSRILHKLYRVFDSYDAKLSEINPLVLTKNGELKAADSKIVIDDYSLFRHPEYKEKTGRHIQNPLEREGKEKGLNYVDLDGNIAIMANGAGLAMATMDLVNLEGESPAAFLDTGGGLNRKRMKNALKVLLKKAKSDRKVKVILLNIRLQISPPDAAAHGLLDALEEMDNSEASIIVVLRGRNQYVEKAKEFLKDSEISLFSDVREGVLEAVKIASDD